MRKLFYFIFALALPVLGGCPKPAPAPISFDLDRPFSMKMGQSATCSELKDFTLRFDRVSADSRCPQGVKCVTAGQVDVDLTLTQSGETQSVTLPFTNPFGSTNVTEFKGLTIRVMGVSPIKFKDKEIKPEDYNIMVSVTKTPPASPSIKLGEDFEISPGMHVSVAEAPQTSIQFDSVTTDSRCPEGVKCIWAGKADCSFTLQNDGQIQHAVLSSGDLSKGGSGTVTLGPFTLSLKAIAPPKKQGVTIDQKEYRATLNLSK